MIERETGTENEKQFIIIVEHCRGKTMRFIKMGATVEQLSEKYQLMANEHDRIIHGDKDPCKKAFLLK